jgi:short-subunit dehydrogenase
MASGNPNKGNVLIIGASRGLGHALAKDYAEQVELHFTTKDVH